MEYYQSSSTGRPKWVNSINNIIKRVASKSALTQSQLLLRQTGLFGKHPGYHPGFWKYKIIV